MVTREDCDLVPARLSTRELRSTVRLTVRLTTRELTFVREFAYRVACYRDRRPTSLKDTLLRRIYFYYSFILQFLGNFEFLTFHPQIFVVHFSLNSSHSISSSC